MTLWQDQPPQTRRQARENERTAAQKASGQGSRRAGTAEPTPAGEIPTVTTPFGSAPRSDDERPAIPASAFAEPGVTPPSRPKMPTYSGEASSLASGPEQPVADDARAADDSGAPHDEQLDGLFRQAPDLSRDEPVTQPIDLAQARAAVAANAPSSEASSPVGERTLTRRELRAMLQAQEANQQAGHPDQVVPATVTPSEEEEPTRPAASEPPTVTSSSPSAWPFAPLAPAAATPAAPSAAPHDEKTPSAGGERPSASTEDEDTTGLERQPFTPPTGHWSTAAELDDKNQPFDQIITRNVGQSGSATTTNALILPSLPNADATGPLTSTGEILVTGSIDLPRSMGATGAHPDIDSSDLDRLLDSDENEFNTSEVAPIRASRAISTHTSTRGVITPPKKRGGRLPIVLMITAGVLAVGVIGLLVAAYVLNVF